MLRALAQQSTQYEPLAAADERGPGQWLAIIFGHEFPNRGMEWATRRMGPRTLARKLQLAQA